MGRAMDCPEGGCRQRLTDGREICPHRPDLADKRFWVCSACNGRVGCHPPGTTDPLGWPAGPELRNARNHVHRVLDPIWRSAPKGQRKPARNLVYAYLAARLGLSRDETHTAMFDIEQCRQAWKALNQQTLETIQVWLDEHQAGLAQ